MAGLETKLVWNGEKEKNDMQDAMVAFLIRATNKVQSDAKLLVRKDTTNLASSIVKAVDKQDLIGTVATNSAYAFYNEFGTGRFAESGTGRQTPWLYKHPKYGWIWTVGMVAQPFMRPALNNNKNNIKKMAIEEGRKAVDK